MKIQDNYGETIAYRFDLLADEASENALIGAILSDGRYAYDRVRDIVRSDNFTSDERMRIFEASPRALGRLTDSGICSFPVDDGTRCDLYKVCGTCRVTRIDTSKHI